MKNFSLIIFTVFLFMISFMSAVTIDSISTNPLEISPGDIVDVRIKLKNNLGVDLENVLVELDLSSNDIPFAPQESSNEYLIEELDDDDKETALFKLIAFPNAKSGTYKIPVTVTYFSLNETVTSMKIISLTIVAAPKIEIFDESLPLIKGQRGDLIIRVINNGLGDAKLMTVGISEVIGLNVFGSTRVYVGNLESDDFEKVEFDVFVKENSLSRITIPVSITYLDLNNNKQTIQRNILLRVYTEEESINLGFSEKKGNTRRIVVILIIILGLLFFRNRRRRKKKK